eukprot:scaffold7594_cov111-Isochrysis_galbana.AAC.2
MPGLCFGGDGHRGGFVLGRAPVRWLEEGAESARRPSHLAGAPLRARVLEHSVQRVQPHQRAPAGARAPLLAVGGRQPSNLGCQALRAALPIDGLVMRGDGAQHVRRPAGGRAPEEGGQHGRVQVQVLAAQKVDAAQVVQPVGQRVRALAAVVEHQQVDRVSAAARVRHALRARW